MSMDHYFALSPASRDAIDDSLCGIRIHRADYPGVLAEARTATTRFCDGFTPTHRGVPTDA